MLNNLILRTALGDRRCSYGQGNGGTPSVSRLPQATASRAQLQAFSRCSTGSDATDFTAPPGWDRLGFKEKIPKFLVQFS